MPLVTFSELKFDWDHYPRNNKDATWIGYLAEAIEAGSELPPIIVCKKTKRVVEGWHRAWAHHRVYGDEAKIRVEYREYDNDQEFFIDATRLNGLHGMRLDRHDRVHCATIAQRLGIDPAEIAAALNMRLKAFTDLCADRSAYAGRKRKEVVPLKATTRHLSGAILTKRQIEGNRRAGGMKQSYFVNQVINLLECNILNENDERLLERLACLHDLLRAYFGKRGG